MKLIIIEEGGKIVAASSAVASDGQKGAATHGGRAPKDGQKILETDVPDDVAQRIFDGDEDLEKALRSYGPIERK